MAAHLESRIRNLESGIWNHNLLLQMVIRKDGTPDSLKVLKALGYGLDESAMDTVTRHWKFEPAMKDGKPVDARVTVEISFRLY